MLKKIRNIFQRSETNAPARSPRTGFTYTTGSLDPGYIPNVQQVMSPGTAMSVSTVYRCVSLLSNKVASLRLRCMRSRQGLMKEDAGDPLNYLFNVSPMPGMSAYTFWSQVVRRMYLDGNAYAVPLRDESGTFYRIVLCTPGTVSYDRTNKIYSISDIENGINEQYDEDEVLHFMLESPDGITGSSIISYARRTMSISATGDRETLSRFASGGNVKGIISNTAEGAAWGEHDPDEMRKLAESTDARLRSGENWIDMAGDVKVQQLSSASTDMQFLENRKFAVRDICRFFGVHPSFVFDDTSNNYKSAELANSAFLSDTLNPLLKSIEVELLRKLVAPGLYRKRAFEFDRSGLVACDLESKVQYQSKRIAAGLDTINEMRRSENKEPLPGGDTILVSANLKSIDALTSEAGQTEENHTEDETHDTEDTEA